MCVDNVICRQLRKIRLKYFNDRLSSQSFNKHFLINPITNYVAEYKWIPINYLI